MIAKVLVERMELVRHIVDEAQRLAPQRITFHWSRPCQVSAEEAFSDVYLCTCSSFICCLNCATCEHGGSRASL